MGYKKKYCRKYLGLLLIVTSFFMLGWAFGANKSLRVELYIDTGDKQSTKMYFNQLLLEREAIEAEIGISLNWDRLNQRRASRISLQYGDEVDLLDTEDKLDLTKQWAVSTLVSFYDAFHKRIRRL